MLLDLRRARRCRDCDRAAAMSDSDDEETAKLRAMRNVAARMDARGGGGMQDLLDRQKRVAAASRSSAFFDDGDDPPAPSKRARQGPSPPKAAAPVAQDEDASLRAMFPGGFGGRKHAVPQKQSPPNERSVEGPSKPVEGPKRPDVVSRDDESDAPVGPKRPTTSDHHGEDDDDDVEIDEDNDDDRLPITDEARFEGHKKVVSALALEHTGSRLLTGSHDYTVRMYDFNGMKRDLKPFREITPSDGYPVHALSWSPSGDRFLVVTGGTQPKIYDRDGRSVGEFDKGDMYIRDLKNTKGHCSPCTGGAWHPLDHDVCVTSSQDGSMRTWSVERLGDPRGSQQAVLKPTLLKPGRVQVTSVTYSKDGTLIAGGINDGSIQIFPANMQGNGNGQGSGYRSASVGVVLPPSQQGHVDNRWSFTSKPKHVVRNAHPHGEAITGVTFAKNGTTLLSRCSDGTLSVWDIRNAKSPIKTFDDLETAHDETSIGFSPNDEYFFTGVDAPRGRAEFGDGALMVYDMKTLSLKQKIGTPGNCVTGLWHERLNQVFVGCGDGKAGHTLGLYDSKVSMRGLVTCVGRKPRTTSITDFVRIDEASIAYTPHALPMFREPMPGQKGPGQSERARRKDAVATKAPAKELGGTLRTGGTLLTQHMMKNNDMIGEKNWRQNDPREAILRHAKDAEANPWRTEGAYGKTQPKPIFAEPEPEEGEESD